MNLERLAPRIQRASRRRSLPSKLGAPSGAVNATHVLSKDRVSGPIASTRQVRDNRHDPSGVFSAQSAGCRQWRTGEAHMKVAKAAMPASFGLFVVTVLTAVLFAYPATANAASVVATINGGARPSWTPTKAISVFGRDHLVRNSRHALCGRHG